MNAALDVGVIGQIVVSWPQIDIIDFTPDTSVDKVDDLYTHI